MNRKEEVNGHCCTVCGINLFNHITETVDAGLAIDLGYNTEPISAGLAISCYDYTQIAERKRAQQMFGRAEFQICWCCFLKALGVKPVEEYK